MARPSNVSGFYKLPPEERLKIIKEAVGLSNEEADLLRSTGGLKLDAANRMIENVIGGITYPFAVATNFLINSRDYFVPMALEEPSVVAAASNAAGWTRGKGGFFTSNTGPVMIGQIQVVGVRDPFGAKMDILAAKDRVLDRANGVDPVLVKFGGGAKDVEVKVIDTVRGPMIVCELIVDCRDAMGANAVNSMAEIVAPMIEELSGGKVLLRIISNLATRRLVRAKAVFAKDAVGGEDVVDGVLDAFAFADADPYRCATHNKGIMNGVVAVALATGQDHRALEAGAHAYAARSGRYRSLSTWEKSGDGDLVGTLEMPMAVGLIGGATAVHPIAKIAVKILGVKTAVELAEVIGAVGLAQNVAALRALASEGIQKGHMKLHARNVATMAGATGDLVDKIAAKMVEEHMVRFDRAKQLVEELSRKP
ncbi:MAG: hydroxymethylglutaryl-CoA reductase, degradative [Thaumarchaeota archaeon]|nr:hydroxymethylglutaryl-CoA reductase, degradative [Nitrososphaerota archaeon]